MKVGFVVGLVAEARLLKRVDALVEIGGGTPSGAACAADRLIGLGVDAIVSFGLAGGLDPDLPAGTVVIPSQVLDGGDAFSCDGKTSDWLGGANCSVVVSTREIVISVADKNRLHRQSAAAAVDLESGAVARAATQAGIPFAVLRAVADPAGRDLPPAALIALNSAGAIEISAVLASVIRQPAQIPTLLAIALDAAKARAALVAKLRRIG